MAEHITGQSGPTTASSALPGKLPLLTSRPETFAERLLNSSAVWLVLMAYWALTDVLIAIFPPGGRQISPDGWMGHLGFTLAGLAAVWSMHRTGFPAAWDARISASRRLLLPTLVGAAGGLLAIGVELVGGALATLEATTGQSLTVAFPGSLLVYSSGAITMEMLYLLLPLPPLLWLISNVILRGRGQAPTFWALALISSAAEPTLQGSSVLAMAPGTIGPGVFAMYVAESFAHNFASAIFLRRYGLLAAVLVRLGHYMVWHVLYGNFLA